MQIDYRVETLKIALQQAQLSLTPDRPHDAAIRELIGATVRTMNILRNLPADHEAPHRPPMSGA